MTAKIIRHILVSVLRERPRMRSISLQHDATLDGYPAGKWIARRHIVDGKKVYTVKCPRV